jgi:tetratricopeptide (TPR) repeat protein
MAAALNACGYNEGLDQSAPVRKLVRDEMDQALAKSEVARQKRDALCLYIAQHRLTGGERDISQYISLSLYLSPPPELEATDDLTNMPPDATQVVEILPLLRDFVAAVDLHGIWLTTRHTYDEAAEQVHDALSQMIVNTNAYLKMPASSYEGRRFIVVLEPMLSPNIVNARVYGLDYVVVVSPVNGKIRLSDVRHSYLHYMIEPLLFSETVAIARELPILKEVANAPMDYRYRSDLVALTIECLIKAIEARTMDTSVPVYTIPAGVDRSDLPKYEEQMNAYKQKVEQARRATVAHDMHQGFVLTEYFYQQMLEFEKDPASLRDTMGELVYSLDVPSIESQAKKMDFDKVADEEVLERSKPRQLTGLDLAEAKLAQGDVTAASSMAGLVVASQASGSDDAARADFILARVAMMKNDPDTAMDDFQKAATNSKEPRIVAWSHIYLGRMMDLLCEREDALEEYNAALAHRDGQQDTRLAAERGVKTAYALKGHSCDEVNPKEAGPKDEPGSDSDKAGQGTSGAVKLK